MSNFYKRILSWFNFILCPKCGSTQLHKGYWHRAWNILCTQGSGGRGKRCFDCGHMQWEQTPQEVVEDAVRTKTDFVSLPYDHPDFKNINISIREYLQQINETEHLKMDAILDGMPLGGGSPVEKKDVLTKYHLGYKMPKPKKEDYMIGVCAPGTCRDCGDIKTEYCGSEAYESALDFYEFVNNPVEPEWIEKRRPAVGQKILPYDKNSYGNWDLVRYTEGVTIPEKWADYNSYMGRIQEWNKYQEKYKGWTRDKDMTNDVFHNKAKDAFVRFDGDSVTIWGPTYHFDSDKPITCQLFELIIEK